MGPLFAETLRFEHADLNPEVVIETLNMTEYISMQEGSITAIQLYTRRSSLVDALTRV